MVASIQPACLVYRVQMRPAFIHPRIDISGRLANLKASANRSRNHIRFNHARFNSVQQPGSFGSLAADGIDGCLTVFSEVFEAFDRLEAEAAKERQGGVAQGSEHLRGMADVGSPLILAAGDITDVMQLVLDAPMLA